MNLIGIKIVYKDDTEGVSRAKEELAKAGYTIVYEDDADGAYIDAFRIGGKDERYNGARVIVGRRI